MVAGTVGPIGFLGLQVAYDLDSLFEIPNVYGVQLFVIVVLTAIIVALVLSGLDKGIQIPSRINVLMALGLMAPVLVVGSVGLGVA